MNDSTDEFEAAFREASEPAADPQDGDPPQPEADDGAASAEQDDQGASEAPSDNPPTANHEIWANASPEQRAAYEAAEARARDLEQRLRSDDGRVARYQRDRDAERRKIETLVTAAQKNGEDLRALLGSEEWRKAKSEYGEDLAPLFNVLERLTDQTAEAQERFRQMDGETIDKIVEANFETLSEKAPDWEKLLGHQDFPTWLQSQPKPWQDAFAVNSQRLVDPTSAIELVNRYRVHLHLTEQANSAPQVQQDPRRARQLDGARTASSRVPVVADPGGNDFEAEFLRAAKTLEKQRR